MNKCKCFVKVKNRAGQVSHLLSLSLSLWVGHSHSIAVYRLVFQRSVCGLMKWRLCLVLRRAADPWWSELCDWRDHREMIHHSVTNEPSCVVSHWMCSLHVCALTLCSEQDYMFLCATVCCFRETTFGIVKNYHLFFFLPCILKCITFRYKTRSIHFMCVYN